jgi:hypothetical protein
MRAGNAVVPSGLASAVRASEASARSAKSSGSAASGHAVKRGADKSARKDDKGSKKGASSTSARRGR